MATQETQQIDDVIAQSRRKMLSLGGAALAGLALAGIATNANAAAATLTDADILNFALNLEYLEANFYTLAATGQTIDMVGLGIGAGTATAPAQGQGMVITKPGGPSACKVQFMQNDVQAYANETVIEEQKHVTLLRAALGASAVAQPTLNLYDSFHALGALVGVANFDPFASDALFLIGAYIFEDVGVTAYGGAVTFISSTSTLVTAAGIHAVEAYHAGLVRTSIFEADPLDAMGYLTLTQKISGVRATASAAMDDIGVSIKTAPLNGTPGQAVTIADADPITGLDYPRTPQQVLSIVTGGVASPYKGLFFPDGLNGTIM
jgi:hypothetical protein